MLEHNKCPKCKYVYEISWDDSADYTSNIDEDDEDNYDEAEELYPEFCPFCGTHRTYGTEDDSFEYDAD